MKITYSLATLLLALGAVTTALAGPVGREFGPNLITNGGFENSSTVAGSGWTASGFQAEGFDFLIDTASGDAQGGTHSFAGGGIGAPGFLSQTFATVGGRSYNIHLWLANFSGFADGTAIQVLWNGSVVYSATDIVGTGYREIVIDPAASGAFSTLSIGLQDDAFFLNVDSVSVRAVPEPAAIALLLTGLAALGARRRRRS